MALNPTNVRTALQFVSTLTIDNIVRVYEGSYDAGAQPNYGGYMKSFTFAHGLTRPVQTKLLWSTDNITFIDGGLSYRLGDASYLPAIAISDSTNISIITGVTAGTIYYKVLAFWLPNYDATNPTVPSYFNSPANKYINFNSNNNYQKIWMQGVVTDSGVGSTTDVTHNLGYLPNVRVYFEAFANEVWPANAGGAQNYFLWDATNQAQLDLKIYTDKIALQFIGTVGMPSRKIWYTIYTDD